VSELIHNLGIEWNVLIAQVVNFAILFFVLNKFAIGPVMKILSEREARLKEEEQSHEKMEAAMRDIAEEKGRILAAARIESQRIIKDAETSAHALSAEAKKVAETEAQTIIAAGKRSVQDERVKAETELKKEIGTLIAFSVEKAVGNAIDKHAHSALVEEAKRIMMSRVE
jgi:F-type H+-transporting ATPase subunit b